MFTIDEVKENKKWPFSEMSINDVVHYSHEESETISKSAKIAAYSYSNNNKKGIKLAVKTLTREGVKYTVIGRVK